MNDQQLQLVTRAQADKLDKLGFDWPTRTRYDNGCDKAVTETATDRNHNSRFVWINKEKQGCSAPTVALALKWMRDVKDMGYEIRRSTIGSPEWTAYIMSEEFNIGWFDAYESAESALLDELLKLIEK